MSASIPHWTRCVYAAYEKAGIRAKVERTFPVLKNLFSRRKTRYKGLDKNTAQLFPLFGCANLMLAHKVG